MTPLSEQRLLDLATVAERTGISPRTWRRIIRAGGITILRIEGCVRIPEESLEEYLASRVIPARELRRSAGAEEVGKILDEAVARHRGRPRIVR
jgi:hypothetical protein